MILYNNRVATPCLTSAPNLFYCFIDRRYCTKSSLLCSAPAPPGAPFSLSPSLLCQHAFSSPLTGIVFMMWEPTDEGPSRIFLHIDTSHLPQLRLRYSWMRSKQKHVQTGKSWVTDQATSNVSSWRLLFLKCAVVKPGRNLLMFRKNLLLVSWAYIIRCWRGKQWVSSKFHESIPDYVTSQLISPHFNSTVRTANSERDTVFFKNITLRCCELWKLSGVWFRLLWSRKLRYSQQMDLQFTTYSVVSVYVCEKTPA
jgi:hypothetical protein